ncbi:MAG TPA: GNAT family N-acetyltransferase [Solirubrobacterales bacterium]|nr:GNAT family N-acetyltransferase [Solirubrobacterales bacterium]
MEIKTERLLLRRFSDEDLDDFVALHADPEVTRFIRPLDRAEGEERLRKDDEEWRKRGHGFFAVAAKSSGEFLGRIAIKYWPQFDETELGWTLRRDAWGHGYATEAGAACRDWALANLDVPYLTAMIVPENTRSIAVAERLGFSRLREDELLGEKVVVYSVRRED